MGRLTARVSAQCSELHVIQAPESFNSDSQHKLGLCLPAETKAGISCTKEEGSHDLTWVREYLEIRCDALLKVRSDIVRQVVRSKIYKAYFYFQMLASNLC